MDREQSWLLHRTFNPEGVIPRWVRVPVDSLNLIILVEFLFFMTLQELKPLLIQGKIGLIPKWKGYLHYDRNLH